MHPKEKEMDKVVTRTSKERGVEKVLMGLDNKEAVRLARLPDGRLKVKIDSKGYNEGIEKGGLVWFSEFFVFFSSF